MTASRLTIALHSAQAAAWISVYLALAAFPVLLLFVEPVAKGGGFWWDFAMALGFSGLAVMGLQFVLTARFRRATAPFGIDIIYYFHRWAALAGAALIGAHYVILRTKYGPALGTANPLEAPWYMTAGRAALGLFTALLVTSLWRKPLRLEYDRWRVGHAVMAVAAIVLAGAHICGAGQFTRGGWKGVLWTAYSGGWLLILVYIRVWRPLRLVRMPYRVTGLKAERGNSWTLTLQPVGRPMNAFSPGQFAWLSLGSSPFRAKEHPFSFSGSAAAQPGLQFTIKELGDFTRTIRNVKVGAVAYVDGPHGVFTPARHPGAPGFVFIAGGVGMAPIMSMLRTLADRGERRPLRLIVGNWRWDDVLFREDLEALRARLTLEVVHVLQEPPPDWRGPKGILTEPVIRQGLPDGCTAYTFFVCGPKPMIDSVQRTLRRRGVPLHRIHFELFDMA